MSDCVFCDIIKAEKYDFANAEVVSFLPLNPVVPGHRLFVPKMHVRGANANPRTTGKTFELASQYASRQYADFNLITSSGQTATQTVFHLHVHYVPRHSGDNLHLPWTGQIK